MSAGSVAVPALDALPLSQAMRELAWAYPTAAIVHVVGIALLVGCVVAFDLRVLGVRRGIPVDALARHLLPIAVASLALIVPSGLAMFAAHASQLLTERVFLLKMLLIFAGGANAVVFHAGPWRGVAAWRTGAPAPPAAKVCAAASIAGWIAVVACGRLLDPG